MKTIDLEITRDGDFEAFGLLDSLTSKSTITFIGETKFIRLIKPNVSCVICPRHAAPEISDSIGIVISENPKRLFFELHNNLSKYPPFARERFHTAIGEDCNIHKMACIAENNVKIGNNVIIEEFVSIKENTVIGDNVIIRAGTIIGGEGFYFIREPNEKIIPVRHFGGVIIEDEAEIQQNCCIDRAYFSWDDTVVGQEAKLDNLLHIAHAIKIGKNAFIVSNASLGGNVKIGNDSWIGPGSTISNNIKIGESSRVSLGAVVARNVADNSTVSGNFAVDHTLFLRDLKDKYKIKK
jgi:UDP-3-O-[3-hydroxymyristoyl] glucosamine N-acyltransferase